MKTATAHINLNALADNLQHVKAQAPDSKVLAVLKANAYGHGLERIAKALQTNHESVDAFGVARIDEALALRAAGVITPIVLLEGFFDSNELALLAVNNLQTIVHNEQQLAALCDKQLVLSQPLKVWLKVDTGMHRLGINPQEFSHYYQSLKASANVENDIVLMSHLGCADDLTNPVTARQINLFNRITQGIDAERSMANSAGVAAWADSHYQWIRPGLMLYGVSPMQNQNDHSIRPVMTLQSSLIATRKLAKGEYVGYGGAWHSEQNTIIGVVAIGYGDGYPRHAKNGTPVLINGRRVPLVGRVSMDMITVDLGINSQDKVGDIATLWGEGLPVKEIADWATTIPYELLCNITRRVQIAVS
ncbi:alanine racemase [Thalassotalea insulae]|uniref:alanine racemase n=1 Tax=Thalassotalea insulae TaxID=2056778 RepID=UPI0024E15603|nr:alanine racemase [Thalassotalea insulae]